MHPPPSQPGLIFPSWWNDRGGSRAFSIRSHRGDITGFSIFLANDSLGRTGLHLSLSAKSCFTAVVLPQKAAFATLCVLCDKEGHTLSENIFPVNSWKRDLLDGFYSLTPPLYPGYWIRDSRCGILKVLKEKVLDICCTVPEIFVVLYYSHGGNQFEPRIRNFVRKPHVSAYYLIA